MLRMLGRRNIGPSPAFVTQSGGAETSARRPLLLSDPGAPGNIPARSRPHCGDDSAIPQFPGGYPWRIGEIFLYTTKVSAASSSPLTSVNGTLKTRRLCATLVMDGMSAWYAARIVSSGMN